MYTYVYIYIYYIYIYGNVSWFSFCFCYFCQPVLKWLQFLVPYTINNLWQKVLVAW